MNGMLECPDGLTLHRGFGLFRGFRGWGRSRYGRRLSAGIGCPCLGRGLLGWLFGLRGCWAATVIQAKGSRRVAAHEYERQGGYGEAEDRQPGAGPSSEHCHLLFILFGEVQHTVDD